MLLILLVGLAAQEAAQLPDDPSSLLGLGLSEVVGSRGLPARLAVARGPEPWQDDVVFEYSDGFSFYWSGDRVWQVRFGPAYKASVFGVFIGDETDKMLSLLGQPWKTLSGALVWRLPWKGYPVELRVLVEGTRAAGMAVLRTDF